MIRLSHNMFMVNNNNDDDKQQVTYEKQTSVAVMFSANRQSKHSEWCNPDGIRG